MADLTITAGQILKSNDTNAKQLSALAGVAIAAGDAVFFDATTGTLKLADSSAAEIVNLKFAAVGIAMCSAAAGQPVTYCENDPLFTLGAGAAPVAGMLYMLSETPGKICPQADLTTGCRLVLIGCGIGSNKINLMMMDLHTTQA